MYGELGDEDEDEDDINVWIGGSFREAVVGYINLELGQKT